VSAGQRREAFEEGDPASQRFAGRLGSGLTLRVALLLCLQQDNHRLLLAVCQRKRTQLRRI
jgi:hypothetical protein